MIVLNSSNVISAIASGLAAVTSLICASKVVSPVLYERLGDDLAAGGLEEPP